MKYIFSIIAFTIFSYSELYTLDDIILKVEMKQHQKLITKAKKREKSALFSSDGCSGGLSIGWEYLSNKFDSIEKYHPEFSPLEYCCIQHDRYYHIGGFKAKSPKESFDQRKKADLKLKKCVADIYKKISIQNKYALNSKEIRKFYKITAELMYKSVRLGGIPCSGLSWRWGYGYPHCDK